MDTQINFASNTSTWQIITLSANVNITCLHATWWGCTRSLPLTDGLINGESADIGCRCTIEKTITTGLSDRQKGCEVERMVSWRHVSCVYACFFLPSTGTLSFTLHKHRPTGFMASYHGNLKNETQRSAANCATAQ